MFLPIKKVVKKIVNRITQRDYLATLSDEDREIIRHIREKNLTYLSDSKLASLATTCHLIEAKNLPGLILETGCALGGSSILLASLKSPQRPLLVYDVFGMIPPPTEEDTQDVHERYRTILEGESVGIGGDKYYGYEQNLLDIVQTNFRSFGIDCEQQSVSFIEGLVQDTLRVDQPIALAHVDVDWYEPVMTCLERIFPKLVVGGSIILDDYHDWGGCRKAADKYLSSVVGQFSLDDSAHSLKITKTHS